MHLPLKLQQSVMTSTFSSIETYFSAIYQSHLCDLDSPMATELILYRDIEVLTLQMYFPTSTVDAYQTSLHRLAEHRPVV